MAEPTLQEEARRAQAACARFEADLTALADGERTSVDGVLISAHVASCDGCRAYVNALAGLSRLHLFGETDAAGELPNGTEMWGDLTRRLLDDNCAKLAALLYELGKALVAAGLRTSADLRGVQLFARKPGSIRQLSTRGQALFRQHRDLAERATRTEGETLHTRRSLFPKSEPAGADEALGAFEAGRACLEQCLRLEPERHEARIYLAKYFSVSGRYDRARQLLRVVLHSKGGGEEGEKLKFFALQQLSRVYSMTRQFERAVELEREVLERAERAGNDLYQAAALTNLSIYCVKLGRLEEAEAAIQRLATTHSERLEEVTVPAYRRARDFKQALLRHRSFLSRLRGRYPSLFSS
jgi:tetratricopeptide (TPR) repeat protein